MGSSHGRAESCASLVDGKNARGWLLGAVEWCEYQAKRRRRALGSDASRHDALYVHYLNGIYALTDIMYTPAELGIRLALPVLNPAPAPLASERDYAKLPRKALAARITSQFPEKNLDAKLLARLSCVKLAHMLAQAEADAAAAQPAQVLRRA